MTVAIIAVLVVGVSTLLWSIAGLARLAAQRWAPAVPPQANAWAVADVAVLVAAHNEQLVIAQTIRSAGALVPLTNVFVVSDGSTDDTVSIATSEGAQVLDLHPNRGKAGALTEAIDYFDLAARFEIVMLLDADTQLAADYFDTGLSLFASPDVVAVAGRATSLPHDPAASLVSRALIAYRERVYVAMQFLYKFGQAAQPINAVAIVPGFASMYRSRILTDIDIAADGLAIEDYNMTFEVHAKKLGRIAFHPYAAIALTQDPATVHDYVAQVSRWNLGFWQTVRRHGPHVGRFWAALGLFIVELVISCMVMVALIPVVVALFAARIIDAWDGSSDTFAAAVVGAAPPELVLLGVIVPDIALTLFAAAVSRRADMLRLGIFFPLLRIADAYLCLRALARAYRSTATGVWKSPARRPVEPV